MIVRDALREGSRTLEAAGSDSAYLDALVLLASASGIDKERLYARLDDSLDRTTLSTYRSYLERRASGVPVAYLTRSKEFFGRDFYVDERVLIPRSDTETLVETALDAARDDPRALRVHDLGSGSGCIALTLKAERPDLAVSASDASADACAVFAINAARLGLEVPIVETAFFDGIDGPFDLIVSNPPYLTDAEAARMEADGWPEPQGALRAGPDGLDCIEQIVCKSVHFLAGNGRLLLEAAPAQMPMIRELMQETGFERVATVKDLAGRERVVGGMRNG